MAGSPWFSPKEGYRNLLCAGRQLPTTILDNNQIPGGGVLCIPTVLGLLSSSPTFNHADHMPPKLYRNRFARVVHARTLHPAARPPLTSKMDNRR